jgi:hypothetical protein
MCSDTEDLTKQCYEWQNSNMSVRSWTMELKDELHNNGLVFAWRKKYGCDLTEITKMVKDRCKDSGR